jgi:hypothetical protein
MARTHEPTMTRVGSRDGTQIAYWTSGEGPPHEGWPVPNPDVYALPPGLEDRMDALLAQGDRDAVVETIFRELEVSDRLKEARCPRDMVYCGQRPGLPECLL